MKNRSKLRKRIRDWLNNRRKEHKEETPLPSFSSKKLQQEKKENPTMD